MNKIYSLYAYLNMVAVVTLSCSLHHMIISSKNMLKMEAVEVSKKRKFQTDQSELSLLPLSKHTCFANVVCSENTNGSSVLDSDYSMSYVNSTTSMECNNEIEMKEESSGSCGEEKMICFERHLDFIHGTQKLEDYSEKDIENILYLGEEEDEAKGCSSNAANFVLSSGRWTVNQGIINRFLVCSYCFIEPGIHISWFYMCRFYST